MQLSCKAWLKCRNVDASKKFVAIEIWSGRKGCNPAGESPVVPVARFRHVVMPHPGMGNHPGYAWCKRPGCLERINAQWWVQPEDIASIDLTIFHRKKKWQKERRLLLLFYCLFDIACEILSNVVDGYFLDST